MQKFPISPGWVFGSLWTHRGLVWQMTRREVIGRYRGSILGILWSVFYPILMLSVYTFVFSFVFKTRWGQSDSRTEFAIMVFVGMIVHGVFSECVTKAPGLIVGNVNYVKKVVFPLETLPWITIGAALFHSAISTVVLLMFFIAVGGHIQWTVVLFPFVLMPLALFTLGASWFLASLGVYLRDVGQIISVVTTVLLFLSPVFYPVSALPEKYRVLMELNPLTPVIEQSRATLILGNMPDWKYLAAYLLTGAICAWLGLTWFQKTRRGFADVL